MAQQKPAEERSRDERLESVLNRGDRRDQAAARRDHVAEAGELIGPDDAAVAREWSARDRDQAAEDRADLVELLRERGSGPDDVD